MKLTKLVAALGAAALIAAGGGFDATASEVSGDKVDTDLRVGRCFEGDGPNVVGFFAANSGESESPQIRYVIDGVDVVTPFGLGAGESKPYEYFPTGVSEGQEYVPAIYVGGILAKGGDTETWPFCGDPTPEPSGSVTPSPEPSGSVTPSPEPSGSVTPSPEPSGPATSSPEPSGPAKPAKKPTTKKAPAENNNDVVQQEDVTPNPGR